MDIGELEKLGAKGSLCRILWVNVKILVFILSGMRRY